MQAYIDIYDDAKYLKTEININKTLVFNSIIQKSFAGFNSFLKLGYPIRKIPRKRIFTNKFAT